MFTKQKRRLIAVDCETDPAQYGRVLAPFIWGAYDGKKFSYFKSTDEFVAWLSKQNVIAYAHNGGKFDFMFLVQYIKETRAQIINGRIIKMRMGKAELRDSIAIVPEALKKFGKKDIEYWKMEEDVREEHMQEIIEYLEVDCVTLYDLVNSFREVAGTKTTIASNAQAFAKKIGVDMGKTNATYDRFFRKFFFGGRCQVFQPGSHKNIRVIDIHSAYPFAMCHDHATGSQHEFLSADAFHGLKREEQQRCFITLKCKSKGAFPFRPKVELTFPNSEQEFSITGWEYVAAVDLGLISDVEFLEIVFHPQTINFTPYVQHWYDYKASWNKKENPIEYTIGKIMLNSLYGKASQNIARYYDYRIMEGNRPVCYRFLEMPNDNETCQNCGQSDSEHGWEINTEYEKIKVIQRPALWKYEFKYGKAWEGHPIYNNVATGASITGFTRAHLLRAIHAIGLENVIYSDTDSIICFSDASLAKISFSEKLGDWADEGTGEIGHFAAKKLYGIKMSDGTEKIASKGSKLKYTDIEALMRGEIVQWKSEFPSFSLAGEASFIVRNIRQTAIPPADMNIEAP